MASDTFISEGRVSLPRRPGGVQDIGTPSTDLHAARFVSRITSGADAGKLNYSGLGERPIGVTQKECSPDDPDVAREPIVPAYLPCYEGLVAVEGKSADAFAIGDRVFVGADGLATSVPNGCKGGYAMTEKSADTDEMIFVQLDIEEAPTFSFSHTVTAGEGTANAATVDTGLGVKLTVLSVAVDGDTAEAGLGAVNGSSDGEIDISATSLSAGEVLTFIVTPS